MARFLGEWYWSQSRSVANSLSFFIRVFMVGAEEVGLEVEVVSLRLFVLFDILDDTFINQND